MKITCESCETRYAIPEERVAGKVLLIRCKECRNVMRVVGPSDNFDIDVHIPPPTLTNAVPLNLGNTLSVALEEPIWWVGIEGRPHGPYNRSEIEALVSRDEVHARSLMWASPWTQWERVAESPAIGWVVEFCLKHLATNQKGDVFAQVPDVSQSFFEAGFVGDQGGYFPDPTLHTGWLVLDERTQHTLETWAQKGSHPVTPRGPMLGAAAAFATGVMMTAVGIVWLAQGVV